MSANRQHSLPPLTTATLFFCWKLLLTHVAPRAWLRCQQIIVDKTTGALALVGTGSHAAVYLARLSGRMVAVKVGSGPPAAAAAAGVSCPPFGTGQTKQPSPTAL